jgi:hypothetical protein
MALGLTKHPRLVLQNVVLWFQGLLLLFSEMEMASVVLMIIKTLSHSDKKQLNQARLAVLKEIVSSQFFTGHRTPRRSAHRRLSLCV